MKIRKLRVRFPYEPDYPFPSYGFKKSGNPRPLSAKRSVSEVRLKILDLLTDYPKNISDLADILDIPMSTMTTHIRLLEQANLIGITVLPGSRGTQKRCSLTINHIDLTLK